MILLDTDILTLYFAGHPRVVQRAQSAEESPVTTIISRIQVRVISGVSGVKNGASFAAIHFAKSRAMAAFSPCERGRFSRGASPAMARRRRSTPAVSPTS